LPPLERIADPCPSMILVDNLATSGWHIEESLTALRAHGAAASAFAWITGAVTNLPRLRLTWRRPDRTACVSELRGRRDLLLSGLLGAVIELGRARAAVISPPSALGRPEVPATAFPRCAPQFYEASTKRDLRCRRASRRSSEIGARQGFLPVAERPGWAAQGQALRYLMR
jgi:hypothetical protein